MSPEWGIEASEGLKAALAAHLDTADEVVLAAGEAGRVHSASIQVLAAFVRTRRQSGRTTRIAPCAAAVRDAAVSLGLAAELGLS
ncbi:MAG: STAS domain-containing protein [Silanimonas sp.]